jgi:hypothetical protein
VLGRIITFLLLVIYKVSEAGFWNLMGDKKWPSAYHSYSASLPSVDVRSRR